MSSGSTIVSAAAPTRNARSRTNQEVGHSTGEGPGGCLPTQDRSKEVVAPGHPGAEDDARRDGHPLSFLPAETLGVSARGCFSTWEKPGLALDLRHHIIHAIIWLADV